MSGCVRGAAAGASRCGAKLALALAPVVTVLAGTAANAGDLPHVCVRGERACRRPRTAPAPAAPAPVAPAAPAPATPAPARPHPPRAAPPHPARTPVDVRAPELIDFVEAEYPPEALAARMEADVVLRLSLDAEGRVTAAEVLEPAGRGFDETARGRAPLPVLARSARRRAGCHRASAIATSSACRRREPACC